MSKPRERWWPYAKNMIRAYPELKQEYEALHSQAVTADLSGVPHGGGASRTTEMIALRQLPETAQKEYDAVTKAIEITKKKPGGEHRIAVVDLVLMKGTHTIAGAAAKLHCSTETASNYHREFIYLVGYCYGFKSTSKSQNSVL